MALLWEGRTKTMEEIKFSVDCRVSFVLKAQIAVDPDECIQPLLQYYIHWINYIYLYKISI